MVRDDLRQVVVDWFGDPDAVLVVDETDDLKKGVHSVGMQRQYTGTAGRIENAQVGVFLGYASRHGHTLIDRRVYLPVSWTEDRDRCQAAGVPEEVEFATKSELAADMITAAVDAGVPARWATADEAYGNSSVFRAHLRQHQLGYVLAVSRSHLVPLEQCLTEFDETNHSGVRVLPRCGRPRSTSRSTISPDAAPHESGAYLDI